MVMSCSCVGGDWSLAAASVSPTPTAPGVAPTSASDSGVTDPARVEEGCAECCGSLVGAAMVDVPAGWDDEDVAAAGAVLVVVPSGLTLRLTFFFFFFLISDDPAAPPEADVACCWAAALAVPGLATFVGRAGPGPRP